MVNFMQCKLVFVLAEDGLGQFYATYLGFVLADNGHGQF